jgi:methylthioribulose-1-phosphate dehydratase
MTFAIVKPMTAPEIDANSLGSAIGSLRDIGAEFHRRGWSLGTSSNYSIRLSQAPYRLLITASGKDKSRLGPDDFVVVDEKGKPVDGYGLRGKPSAETLLHVVATQKPEIGSVLHTHSVWSTSLSDLYHHDGGMVIEGYEMLKGLEGVKTHEHRQWVTIFENTQDIPALAQQVQKQFDADANPLQHGFLLRRHGLYTWGRDVAEARRHIEIFEFLFESIGRTLALKSFVH